MLNLLKKLKKEIPGVIFIITLSIFINSCTQQKVKKEYYDNGNIKSELKYKNGKTVVEQKLYYPSGNIQEIHKRTNGMTQFEKYYENGNLASTGQVKNKNRINKWNYYHEEGYLEASGMYNNNGSKEGKWEYYSDKKVKKIVFWEIFIDTTHKFEINYPNEWSIRTDVEGTILIASPKNTSIARLKKANFNVLKIDIEEQELYLEEITSRSIMEVEEAYKDFKFELLSNGEDKINGFDANWVTYSLDRNNERYIIMQFFIKRKSDFFQLSFFVLKENYLEYINLYKEIAYSFK